MLYRYLRSNYYSIIEPLKGSFTVVFEAEHPVIAINEDKIVYLTSSNKPVKGYIKNSTAILKRKLYIVDDLLAKALIGIDIMKPEGIVVDLGNDVMRIGAYNNMEGVPAYSNIAVLITGPKRKLELPDNGDLIFEPRILN